MMKRFFYSPYTKTAAALLCVVCIVMAALSVTHGVARFYEEEEYIYGFENSFEETEYFSYLLSSTENVIHNAYAAYDGTVPFSDYLGQMLQSMAFNDRVNYVVSVNGQMFTNCGATSAEDLKKERFYLYTKRDQGGNVTRETSQAQSHYYVLLEDIAEVNQTDEIVICTSVKEEYVATCEKDWERQAVYVKEAFMTTFVFVLLALLFFTYLLCVAGKSKNGSNLHSWVDHIWTEIHLFLIGAVGMGAIVSAMVLLDTYLSGSLPLYLVRAAVASVAAAGGGILLTSILSIVRKIKCKRFIETSAICRFIRWFFVKLRLLKTMLFGAFSKKTGVILISMLFVFTATIGLCGIFTPEAFAFFFFAIVLFGFAAFVVAWRAKDLDEVKKGAEEIRNGNLTYKICEPKSEDMKDLALNINEIGDGLEKSVSARVRAERMKTELITNVSHDLKTPLTSIISYTELLSKIENLPEEARDYVEIIAKKSERLRQLTQDLFAVSKVQSGNETMKMEKLDVALLTEQALGERDGEIRNAELPFCVETQKGLCIMADGGKMSRVLGNLLDNALKYAMKNTRVFLRTYEKDDRVVIELKNTSAYPMQFDGEEIVGRFVRGDASRTDGGSGLGLAIAKGYTEACGGTFRVIVDGDLFKVLLSFPQI